MKFWDSSALVPLLVEEELTDRMIEVYDGDSEVVVWWGTQVECASALARVERQGTFDTPSASEAFARLTSFAETWHEIEPGRAVRETAQRLLRVHDLRAADSLQLASAFWASEVHPSTLQIVTLDDRLAQAAQREGFDVVDRQVLARSD